MCSHPLGEAPTWHYFEPIETKEKHKLRPELAKKEKLLIACTKLVTLRQGRICTVTRDINLCASHLGHVSLSISTSFDPSKSSSYLFICPLLSFYNLNYDQSIDNKSKDSQEAPAKDFAVTRECWCLIVQICLCSCSLSLLSSLSSDLTVVSIRLHCFYCLCVLFVFTYGHTSEHIPVLVFFTLSINSVSVG